MKKRDDTIVNGKAPGPDVDTALHPCLGQGDGQKRSWADNPASFLSVFFVRLPLQLLWTWPEHWCSVLSPQALVVKVGTCSVHYHLRC